MGRRKRGWLVLMALLAWFGQMGEGRGQEVPPPESLPVPSQPPAALLGALTQPRSPGLLTAPAACAPFEDRNGPLLQGDPLLDRPGTPPPGWFAAAELDFFAPSITNHLRQPVSVAGLVTNTVQVPTASLDWTAAPRFELGYRFTQGAGAVLVSYYGMNTNGTAIIPSFDAVGAGLLNSRLETNVVDVDYSNYAYFLGPRWLLMWKVGARLSQAFFDSRATGTILEERVSNFYLGAGPHLGVDLHRALNLWGLELFGRAEVAGNIGRLTQGFEETFFAVDRVLGGATKVSVIQWVPNTRVMAGLGWTPPNWPLFNVSSGYIFEGWWYLGEAKDSAASLALNGLFLRATWRY